MNRPEIDVHYHLYKKSMITEVYTEKRASTKENYVVVSINNLTMYMEIDQAETLAKHILSVIQEHQQNQMKEGELID